MFDAKEQWRQGLFEGTPTCFANALMLCQSLACAVCCSTVFAYVLGHCLACGSAGVQLLPQQADASMEIETSIIPLSFQVSGDDTRLCLEAKTQ
jgi:hypothetical protein